MNEVLQICPDCSKVFGFRLGARTKGVCSICGSPNSYEAFVTYQSKEVVNKLLLERLRMEVYHRQFGDAEFQRRYP